MANKKQLKHGFMFMYEKDGYYYGSYDLFPSKDDVKLIKVAVWRGYEAPEEGGGGSGGEGTLNISNNGTYDVSKYASAKVNIEKADDLTAEAQDQLVDEEDY